MKIKGFKTVILLVIIAAGLFNVARSTVYTNGQELPSKYPVVYVDPPLVEGLDIGDTFTISVKVYNLTKGVEKDPDNPRTTVPLGNLYGFDIQFTWDPTVIQYVNHTVTAPVEKYPGGVLHEPILDPPPKDVVNETGVPGAVSPEVRAWFSYASMLPAEPFNGNGTIFNMTFRVVGYGISPLKIVECTLASADGKPIARGSEGTWLNPPMDGKFRNVAEPSFTCQPTIGVAGKIMNFTASVEGNLSAIQWYHWDFGDGSTPQNITVPTIQHTFTSSGVYNVTLKVAEKRDGQTIEGVPYIGEVLVAASRDLAVTKIGVPSSVYVNTTFSVSVEIANLGVAPKSFSEQFNLTIYYNTTTVDYSNPAAASWALLNTTSGIVTNSKTITVEINSSVCFQPDRHYVIRAIISGIPTGYEANLTNNQLLSTSIDYTSEILHNPKIISFRPSINLSLIHI